MVFGDVEGQHFSLVDVGSVAIAVADWIQYIWKIVSEVKVSSCQSV